MFLHKIGSLNTVPPKMLRIVPFGDNHIFFNLNSSTLCSSGVIVAHLMPTLCFRIACAASIVTWSFVWSLKIFIFIVNGPFYSQFLLPVRQTQIIIKAFNFHVREYQGFFDFFPYYSSHLVSIHFNNRIFCHNSFIGPIWKLDVGFVLFFMVGQ